jgi:5'-AMP-activated protein kinase regulatory beta subunit
MGKSKSQGRRSVTFTVRAEPDSEVYVGGTFNDWDFRRSPLVEGHEPGVFVLVCVITPGTHEYKFQVNGDWVLDPENPCLCGNAFGSLNNVLEVR